MKKLTLILCALAVLTAGAFAGTQTYSSKNVAAPPPCPQWYADNEWTIGISGIYATGVNSGGDNNDIPRINPLDEFPSHFTVGRDLLGNNNVWGVAGDFKYFFHRYFGVGIQGFGLALSTDDVTIDGVRV